MTEIASSLALDRQALAAFDKLVDASAERRAAELQRLQTEDPALHRALQRMLVADENGASSGWLSAPVIALLRDTGPRLATGDRIAGWRLLRELGRGGMSVVWLAERAEGGLKREVAIKLPLSAQPVLAERFARERDVLAALDHPHIARLFDAGVSADGQPYIVLEYVAGQPITEAIVGMDLRARLALFRQVLSAVQHAHQHLVVHRDLKPSNILVDKQGRVKLLDFGIAKLLDPPADSAALTLEAQVLTPRYAAPEQVLGHAVSTATDVYAAGVVLYELLCGRLPYAVEPAAMAQLIQAVAHVDPSPPGVSRDVDTILLKALRKDPRHRYTSIERFDEDLRRVLADEPILARRVPWAQRLRLLVRRHRGATVAASVAALVLLTSAAVAWHQARQTTAQKERGDAVRDFVFSMMADAEPATGQREVTGKQLLDAAVLRARAEFADQPRLRGELLGELGRVYFRLQQFQPSIDVLQESLSLLQARTDGADPPLNRTRAILARSLMFTDAPHAASLAHQALADCPRTVVACADARTHAWYALGALASWQGDHQQTLHHARAMAEETRAAFGDRSAQMGPALETLAIAARNAGELAEAAAAIAEARRLPGVAQMRAANRDRLDLTQAVIDIDLGQHAAGAALLQELLDRDAPTAERASQWRAMAASHLGLGLYVEAMRDAEQAEAVLSGHAPTAANWLARLSWAQAASHHGSHAQAGAAFEQAIAGLARSGFAGASESLMRARRAQAEALLRAGRDGDAIIALNGLLIEHQGLQPLQAIEFARVLDALGCSASLAGDQEIALRRHADAQERYATALPADHPLRLRSQAMQSMAAGDTQGSALARFRDTLASDAPGRQASWRDCRDVD